jgi:hypothetical protein
MKKFLAAALMLGFATFACAQAPATTTPATTTGKTTTTPAASGVRIRAKGQNPERTGGDTRYEHTVIKSPRNDSTIDAALSRSRSRTQSNASNPTVQSKTLTGVTVATFGKENDGRRYYINKDGIKTYLKDSAKVKAN